jgi:hypothetical protein
MKPSQNYFRLIGIILFMSTIVCSASYGKVIPESVIKSFQTHFGNATHITWHQEKQVYYATFNNGEQRWIAFINGSGELMTSGRKIPLETPPLTIQRDLKLVQTNHEKKYGQLTLARIYELISADETMYYITLENKDRLIALQSVHGNINILSNKKVEPGKFKNGEDIVAKK